MRCCIDSGHQPRPSQRRIVPELPFLVIGSAGRTDCSDSSASCHDAVSEMLDDSGLLYLRVSRRLGAATESFERSSCSAVASDAQNTALASSCRDQLTPREGENLANSSNAGRTKPIKPNAMVLTVVPEPSTPVSTPACCSMRRCALNSSYSLAAHCHAAWRPV